MYSETKTSVYPNEEWSLGYAIISDVMTRLSPGDTILEFGSGESSRCLSELGLQVYSIEEDEEFVNKHEGVNYIHAPIDPKTKWYDMNAVMAGIPSDFRAMIIDGPMGGDRSRLASVIVKKIISNTQYLPLIIIDDFQRPEGHTLLVELVNHESRVFANFYDIHIKYSGHVLADSKGDPGYEGSYAILLPKNDRTLRRENTLIPCSFTAPDKWLSMVNAKNYKFEIHSDGSWKITPSKESRIPMRVVKAQKDD